MKKIIKTYKELPFEEGKTYKTKFQTGENVFLERIDVNISGKIIGFGVIYENSKHLGVCSLSPDRLIPDKIENGEICVCDKCGEQI